MPGVQVEEDGREIEAVARNQNSVYVMPHDWASIAQFLQPLLERVDERAHDVQLLVVTPDAELAAVVTAAAARLTDRRDVGLIAATSASRAARLLRLRPPQVLAGAPDILVALLRGASVKLDTVRMVCLAWADDIVTRDASADLETLMAEVPKDSARVVVTSELTPAVEALLERYARRARRVVAATSDTDQPMNVEYLAVSAPARLSALRRLLDATDPKSAVVFVRDRDNETAVRDLLRALGYAGDAAAVKIGRVAEPGTELALLFDLPASREELREAGGGATRVVAIVQPRQLASLRALAAGGTTKPIILPDAQLRARDRDNRIRAELREALEARQFGRELLMLEPLLDEYDGLEVAAVAVQLLERERAARQSAVPVSAAPRERADGEMTRLFVNVGTRDGARASDLVGAIASQAAIDSSEIGKVDVRESHSVVEVSASVASDVIERVTGTSIRGRRAVVRKDEERPARGGERTERGAPRGKERGPRSGASAGGRERADASRAPRGRDRE